LKQKLCRYCENMVSLDNGEGGSACKFGLGEQGPEKCGLWKLAKVFEGNDPSPEVEDISTTVLSEGNALVRVKPEIDPAIISLHNEAVKLQNYAEAREIEGDDDVKLATNDLNIISKLKKAIEEKRKEYTQPINASLKAVNDAFKILTEPIIEADKITRKKILTYQEEVEKRQREAEAIARLKQEAAEREAALNGKPVEQPTPTEVIAPTPDRYHTEMGTLGKLTVRKWEVEDFAVVPDEYKMIDASKVGRVVRAGVSSIPGIKIWEGKTLRVSPK